MDIQKVLDVMNEVSLRERTRYHLTLGDLMDCLKDSEKELPVEFSDGGAPVSGASYRGFYSDFAFERGESTTVEQLQAYVEDEVLNQIFYGYKGGDFVMDKQTPLWVASYGDLGLAIIDYLEQDDRVVLITRDLD